jgi:hypothetical protein
VQDAGATLMLGPGRSRFGLVAIGSLGTLVIAACGVPEIVEVFVRWEGSLRERTTSPQAGNMRRRCNVWPGIVA